MIEKGFNKCESKFQDMTTRVKYHHQIYTTITKIIHQQAQPTQQVLLVKDLVHHMISIECHQKYPSILPVKRKKKKVGISQMFLSKQKSDKDRLKTSEEYQNSITYKASGSIM